MPELREDVDVGLLLAQLRSTRIDEPKAAAVALDDVASTEEIERALIIAAHDDDKGVRRAALHSLSCGHCKPDGCLGPAAVEVLVDALLHDPSIQNRRWAAGVTMFHQVGASSELIGAYRHVLADDRDRVLRERAATFLAYLDVPKGERKHRDWHPEWQQRYEELLAS